MSKIYIAPKLTTYGNVSQITLQSLDSGRNDVLVGVDGVTILSRGVGSLDACLQQGGSCVRQ